MDRDVKLRSCQKNQETLSRYDFVSYRMYLLSDGISPDVSRSFEPMKVGKKIRDGESIVPVDVDSRARLTEVIPYSFNFIR